MSFNPFKEKPKKIESVIMSWNDIFVKPYNKNEVSPYTKTRVILMNGTEYESNWFLHQLARNCNENDIRRAAALVRNQEQQQQKRRYAVSCISSLILQNREVYNKCRKHD